LSGVGGEHLGAGVAGTVIADLGEQAGCGDDALAVAEEGQEGRPVWVGSEGASDLTGELAYLLNDGSQRGDDAEYGSAACFALQFAGDRYGAVRRR
jgi:hypothetical protein